MDYSKLTVEELKQGIRRDAEAGVYICNVCGMRFADGQVYPMDGKYFTPEHAAAHHVADVHGGSAAVLIYADTKYNSLTENPERFVVRALPQGKATGILPKRFRSARLRYGGSGSIFGRRPNRAKHYLAVYEQVFDARESGLR